MQLVPFDLHSNIPHRWRRVCRARRRAPMTAHSWINDLVEHFGFSRVARQPWAPPAAEDFQRLEGAIGAALPPAYRHFLTFFGGTSLGDDDFMVKAPINEPCSWGESVRPELFYPLLPAHRDSLEKQEKTFRGRLPRGVLPIAHDAGGNLVCLDVAGEFPGSLWFWDHEQRWFFDYFSGSLEAAAQELDAAGINAHRFSVHDIIRAWARLHAGRFDRPPDYMGMYRIAPTFADFLRKLHRVPY